VGIFVDKVMYSTSPLRKMDFPSFKTNIAFQAISGTIHITPTSGNTFNVSCLSTLLTYKKSKTLYKVSFTFSGKISKRQVVPLEEDGSLSSNLSPKLEENFRKSLYPVLLSFYRRNREHFVLAETIYLNNILSDIDRKIEDCRDRTKELREEKARTIKKLNPILKQHFPVLLPSAKFTPEKDEKKCKTKSNK